MRPKPERNWKREPTAVDALTVRIGYRICSAIYLSRADVFHKRCDCEQRGRNQCCDAMLEAARSAMTEIMKGDDSGA